MGKGGRTTFLLLVLDSGPATPLRKFSDILASSGISTEHPKLPLSPRTSLLASLCFLILRHVPESDQRPRQGEDSASSTSSERSLRKEVSFPPISLLLSTSGLSQKAKQRWKRAEAEARRERNGADDLPFAALSDPPFFISPLFLSFFLSLAELENFKARLNLSLHLTDLQHFEGTRLPLRSRRPRARKVKKEVRARRTAAVSVVLELGESNKDPSLSV